MVESFETIQSVFRETLYRKAQVLQKSRERGSSALSRGFWLAQLWVSDRITLLRPVLRSSAFNSIITFHPFVNLPTNVF